MAKPKAMTNRDRCKSCGAQILFIRTKGGAMMPCNQRVLTVITDQGETVRGRESHFATCPNADDFRRR